MKQPLIIHTPPNTKPSTGYNWDKTPLDFWLEPRPFRQYEEEITICDFGYLICDIFGSWVYNNVSEEVGTSNWVVAWASDTGAMRSTWTWWTGRTQRGKRRYSGVQGWNGKVWDKRPFGGPLWLDRRAGRWSFLGTLKRSAVSWTIKCLVVAQNPAVPCEYLRP